MQELSQIQVKLLKAREDRYLIRQSFTQKQYVTISLSLNVPGFPKSNDLIIRFFKLVLSELLIFAKANRIEIIQSLAIESIDDDGVFFISPVKQYVNTNPLKVKEIAEEFEANHCLGRFIDVDVCDNNAEIISSGKEKKCFFCGQYSAISCMRNKRHPYSEMREFLFKKISLYVAKKDKTKLINKLSQLATRSLLYELALSDKPGLVSLESSGNHSDMNHITFINSIAAISSYFQSFCELSYHFNGNYSQVLPNIRAIGLECEKEMFAATQNVNTHKGIIFLLGISLFATSLLLNRETEFSDQKFQEIVKNITKDISKNELKTTNNNSTHGEQIFSKYGDVGTGIRGEVESGFNTVFYTALPYFSENLDAEKYRDTYILNQVLTKGLLHIMAKNNDSNVLYRSNLETLETLKSLSKKVLTSEITYDQLLAFCADNNLSPGGSADLLAISLFLHFVKTEIL